MLFCMHYSDGNVTDGIVLNLGYQTLHILPVLDGRVVAAHAKRSIVNCHVYAATCGNVPACVIAIIIMNIHHNNGTLCVGYCSL